MADNLKIDWKKKYDEAVAALNNAHGILKWNVDYEVRVIDCLNFLEYELLDLKFSHDLEPARVRQSPTEVKAV